ncbi:hypothetical protein ACJQWK_10036 [Exserohilum turcicum]
MTDVADSTASLFSPAHSPIFSSPTVTNMLLSFSLSLLIPHTHMLLTPYTKCPGSKKFATPSLTAYSCSHAPHTNFPSFMHVSSSTLCRSFAVWLGSSSSSSCCSAPAGAESGVSRAEAEVDDGSTRSAGVGAVGGRAGRPSYSRYIYPLENLFFFSPWCIENEVQSNNHTSLQMPRNSSHKIRGKMFFRNARLTSVSTISSSASRGCSGKEAGFVLHVLMAQVRKLRVRSFIFFFFLLYASSVFFGGGGVRRCTRERWVRGVLEWSASGRKSVVMDRFGCIRV